MEVCKHGFTNMVSNVMTRWYFLSYNHQCFHVQIKFNMAHEIFQWPPLIFNDFSRQNAIFPGQHKIPWLFKSRVKFHDFSRPVRTMDLTHWSPGFSGNAVIACDDWEQQVLWILRTCAVSCSRYGKYHNLTCHSFCDKLCLFRKNDWHICFSWTDLSHREKQICPIINNLEEPRQCSRLGSVHRSRDQYR